MKKYNYAVLGAGRQGGAIAYDLARFGDAGKIILIDRDEERMEQVRSKICRLLGKDVIRCVRRDYPDDDLHSLLSNVDVCVSSLPYFLNNEAAKAALDARTNFCDLGGNTDIVWRELTLDEPAKAAGISIIPDCGLMPGAGNILAAYALTLFDKCDDIMIYVGGLPQNPKPPLNYRLTFSAEGLLNEYIGKANILRNGLITEVDALTEAEPLFGFDIGACEAFITSGGTSTAPWSFRGRVKNYSEKTIRYMGHLSELLLLRNLGLFDKNPLTVGGKPVIPQELLKTLLEKNLGNAGGPDDRDLVLFLLKAKGRIDDVPVNLQIRWEDRFDETTGLSAMERTTGFSAAIVAIMQAKGEVPKGALPPERAVDPGRFTEELKNRNFDINSECKIINR